jgi:hypothetical protein
MSAPRRRRLRSTTPSRRRTRRSLSPHDLPPHHQSPALMAPSSRRSRWRAAASPAPRTRSARACRATAIPVSFTSGFANGASGVSLRALSVNSTVMVIDGDRRSRPGGTASRTAVTRQARGESLAEKRPKGRPAAMVGERQDRGSRSTSVFPTPVRRATRSPARPHRLRKRAPPKAGLPRIESRGRQEG